MTHLIEEPATRVSIDVRFLVEDAYAAAFGAPFARAAADIGVEAWPTKASWAYKDVHSSIAVAESPIGEDESGEQMLTLSLTLGDGQKLIQGPVEISVPVVAEATTRAPHAPAGSLPCSGDCVSAGRAEARISATIQSVTVREER